MFLAPLPLIPFTSSRRAAFADTVVGQDEDFSNLVAGLLEHALFGIIGILQALRQKRPLRRGEAVVEKAEGAVFVLCSSFSFPNGGASSPAGGWRGGLVGEAAEV